ncbi:DUF4934 domain-containing protein [Odoribacter lunatus]|uniref:DUF4934 domain-containing protein n=1 Tax=Odoribacter lunatus TaxID=2941335 RepID=UPI0020407ED7|nr:DUF4934 domain-containing protein [Odoribacter lunatus]
MKTMKYLFLFLVVSLFFACGEKQTAQEKVIRLEEKIAAPEENLKTSDYFASITYIPLQTTDSSLIGSRPRIAIERDRVYVGSSKSSCLVFDLNTGKFITSIGSMDKGPQGYKSSTDLWINPAKGVIYFPGWKDEFIKYSTTGEFLGIQKKPAGAGDAAAYSYLDANTLLARCESFMGKVPEYMLAFDEEGQVVNRYPGKSRTDSIGNTSDIASISFYGTFGAGLSGGGVVLIKTKEAGKERILMMQQPVFCHWDGKTFYKDSYNDTVFSLTANEMTPAWVLDMGKYRLPQEEQDSREARKEKGTVNQVMESNRYLMFSYFFYPKEAIQAYRGVFDKKTGKTDITLYENGFTDDLNGFMSIHPALENWDNSLVAFLLPIDIQTWFEEHPEEAEKLKPEIRRLKEIKEDDNPVLVIARLKN